MILKKIWKLLIGDRLYFSLEERIFHGFILLCSINAIVFLIQNYFMNFKLLSALCAFTLFVVFIFYYYSRYKYKYDQILFFSLTVILFIVCVFWLLNGGSIGASQYFLITNSSLEFLLLRGFKRNILLFLLFTNIILIICLFLIEYLFPNLIIQYPDRMTRFLDISIGLLVALVLNFLFLSFFTESYDDEKSKSERLLLNILPTNIAEELKTKGSVEPCYFESVTIMFTDFKGFTKIAESVQPKELIDQLDECFSYFDSLIDKYNLEKLKTIGDSYMCAGGIPIKNSTHPIDCVLAALEIQNFMKKMKHDKEQMNLPYWELRLGIHTGHLIAGVIGKKKFAYDIWGDTVNIASRMESSGIVDSINISKTTFELIEEFFECEYRGKIFAKGKGELDMYLVNGIRTNLSIKEQKKEPNELFFELYNLRKQMGLDIKEKS